MVALGAVEGQGAGVDDPHDAELVALVGVAAAAAARAQLHAVDVGLLEDLLSRRVVL